MEHRCVVRPYVAGDLDAVLALVAAESWPSYASDRGRTRRALTAAGSIALVAELEGEVVGLAHVQSDGAIQAHLSLLVVGAPWRRCGIGRALVMAGVEAGGAGRLDLLAEAPEFYASLPHRELRGFRVYSEGPAAEGSAPAIEVRPLAAEDRAFARALLRSEWGLPVVSISGPYDHPEQLPGLVAEWHGVPVGLATYRVGDDDCELVTLHATLRRRGVGTQLLRGVLEAAGPRRCWLITTNENLGALAFYQRAGMELVAVHRDFVEVVARHKRVAPPAPGEIAFRHAVELQFPRRA